MKQKHPAETARRVYAELTERLSGCTQRILAAGSLRRGREQVGDLEVLYIPAFVMRQKELFSQEAFNLAEDEIQHLLANDVLVKRPNINGGFTWGEKNKLAIHKDTGLPVDLFQTTDENWFMSLVIRTGPKDFNLRLIESAGRKGLKVHAYGVFEKMTTGEKIVPSSEREVLELAGLPWIEPKDRV